ncbi:hypothetical protein CcI49_16300 [Frankia sp. CcI49]|uniref:DUF4259 domain-containing protein n=1 Tax=Frankia sp. CcI49 TaxID=1745382 RepID=UPI0009788F98|nr:DUF4259 domain-containing protein [Frankia sp. CcI49]ONH59535.1 hypothetical protein CcI49_16300 [Frankia sp. CcI49]
MGVWGPGPFANDDAADFAGDLDDLAYEDRGAALAQALSHAIEEDDYLEYPGATAAIASAALIAARFTGTEPVDSNHGPKEPLPPLRASLVPLAIQAVDRVLASDCEHRELWDDADGPEWLDQATRLRETLTALSGQSTLDLESLGRG